MVDITFQNSYEFANHVIDHYLAKGIDPSHWGVQLHAMFIIGYFATEDEKIYIRLPLSEVGCFKKSFFDTISHETIHNVLHTLFGPKVSGIFDNICDGSRITKGRQ